MSPEHGWWISPKKRDAYMAEARRLAAEGASRAAKREDAAKRRGVGGEGVGDSDGEERAAQDREAWEKIFPDLEWDGYQWRSRLLAEQHAGVTDEGAHFDPEDGDQGKAGKRKRGHRSGWPRTDEEWEEYARTKLAQPGATLELPQVRSGRGRGLSIRNLIQGKEAVWRWPCGCEMRTNRRGEQFWNRCGRDDCQAQNR